MTENAFLLVKCIWGEFVLNKMTTDVYREAFLILVSGIIGAFISTIFKPILDKKKYFIFILILFLVFILIIISLLIYELLWRGLVG